MTDPASRLAEIEAALAVSTLDWPAGHPIYTATRAVLAYMLTIPEADRIEFTNSGAFYNLHEWERRL